ncbi:MAG: serine acetyltransferase [Bacilli bacterium]|nr:serine acetyltransferase [Bacilli bacterium]
MINSKQDLKLYLERDKIALRKYTKYPKVFTDEIWKFEIVFRKYEYYSNVDVKFKKIRKMFYHFLYHRWSIKLGFSIPINTFGPGLSIAHYGTIVVNSNTKIGKNCRIQENVTIGATNGSSKAPIIGDNVFIGSGAKIIGNISIADDICIGAGAVVVNSFNDPGITIAGVPAKKISNNNSHSNINPAVFKES